MVREHEEVRNKLRQEVISEKAGDATTAEAAAKFLKPLTQLLSTTEGEPAPTTPGGKKITRMVDLANNILTNMATSDVRSADALNKLEAVRRVVTTNLPVIRAATEGIETRLGDIDTTLTGNLPDIRTATQTTAAQTAKINTKLDGVNASLLEVNDLVVRGSLDLGSIISIIDRNIPAPELVDDAYIQKVVRDVATALDGYPGLSRTNTTARILITTAVQDALEAIKAETRPLMNEHNKTRVLDTIRAELSVKDRDMVNALKDMSTRLDAYIASLPTEIADAVRLASGAPPGPPPAVQTTASASTTTTTTTSTTAPPATPAPGAPLMLTPRAPRPTPLPPDTSAGASQSIVNENVVVNTPHGSRTVTRTRARSVEEKPGKATPVAPRQLFPPAPIMSPTQTQNVIDVVRSDTMGNRNRYTTGIDLSVNLGNDNILDIGQTGFSVHANELGGKNLRVYKTGEERAVYTPGRISENFKTFLMRGSDAIGDAADAAGGQLEITENDMNIFFELLRKIDWVPPPRKPTKYNWMISARNNFQAGMSLENTVLKVVASNPRGAPQPTGTTGSGFSSLRSALSSARQPPRNAYKIGAGGVFGDLIIDPDMLARHRLRVLKKTKGGAHRLIMKEETDKDLVDLLTKRFNKRRKYSDRSIEQFSKLVKKSNLPVADMSGKYSLAMGSGPRGYQGGCMESKIVKIVTDPNALIERMALLIGSIESGNTSPHIRNEVMEIIDILLTRGAIDQATHRMIFEKYLAPDI